MTAMAEFVVPKSMPRIFAIMCFLSVGVVALRVTYLPFDIWYYKI